MDDEASSDWFLQRNEGTGGTCVCLRVRRREGELKAGNVEQKEANKGTSERIGWMQMRWINEPLQSPSAAARAREREREKRTYSTKSVR